MKVALAVTGILLLGLGAHATDSNAPPTVTHHALKVAGKTINYSATAGFLPLRNDAGKLQAEIFFVAYVKDGIDSNTNRAISFAFNGGPGASAMWLHVGGIGPKRAAPAGNGLAAPKAYRLVDNEQTWLNFTDLVFIDPIGTGYSHTAPGVDEKQFFTIRKDVDVAGRFIREYVTHFGRWLSPKFLVGESYGTTRAAALANHLQSADGLNLDGVILLSSALNFEAFSYDEGNDIAFALALPSLSVAAAYHKRATLDLQQVENWALGDYLTDLARGDSLLGPEKKRLIEQVAEYTGLSTNYVATSRLRVSAARFTKELLRNEQRTIGSMDSRVVGVDVTPLGDYPDFDPAFFSTTSRLVETLNDYLRYDLQFQADRPYEFLSHQVNVGWKWTEHGQGYTYVADDLGEAMARDPKLRVFAAAGRYDLTTPYLGQRYTFDHMGLDPALRRNLTFKVYEAGHQIYSDPEAIKQLYADVAAFVATANGGASPSTR